jgi:predicted MarR family transcription regulator
LLARGSASAGAAGKVNVTIHVTAKGRHALSHSHRVRAKLITTLKAASGAKLNLETRTVTLHR